MDSYLFIALLSLREEAHRCAREAGLHHQPSQVSSLNLCQNRDRRDLAVGDFLLAREENFQDCRRRKTTCDLLVLDVSE